MKKSFPLILLLFFSNFCLAQLKQKVKTGSLSKEEYKIFREYLESKNLAVKDTIFIKYDFNNETCWDMLDRSDKEYINNILVGFQKHISDFNKQSNGAIAYNFREPGKNFNKLKLWDPTIIIDDNLFLRKLFFNKKHQCGTSLLILGDGSFATYSSDPHFEFLQVYKNYGGKKF